MYDSDFARLTIEFRLNFDYPTGPGNGYIRIEMLDSREGFNYGIFEQLAVEGNGPPLYRYRDKYFRSAAAIEKFVADELPKSIADQMTARYNGGA